MAVFCHLVLNDKELTSVHFRLAEPRASVSFIVTLALTLPDVVPGQWLPRRVPFETPDKPCPSHPFLI